MIGRWTQYPLSYTEKYLQLLGTLGVDTGLGSDGVHIGTSPVQAVGVAAQKDYAATPVYTDYTAEANSAGANDVLCFPTSPILHDAFQFGGAAKWYGADITIGTQADMVATTIWEYYKTTGAWGTLTPALDETTIMQVAGTGSKKLRFAPPTDWAPCVSGVTGDETLYYLLRCRISAFTSSTTEPLVSRIYLRDLTHGVGIKWPVTATVKYVRWNAGTLSGATADSKFLLINLTQGTCGVFTITKAIAAGEYGTSLGLGVSEGDSVIVVQIQEDASTEFANLQLWFSQRV